MVKKRKKKTDEGTNDISLKEIGNIHFNPLSFALDVKRNVTSLKTSV